MFTGEITWIVIVRCHTILQIMAQFKFSWYFLAESLKRFKFVSSSIKKDLSGHIVLREFYSTTVFFRHPFIFTAYPWNDAIVLFPQHNFSVWYNNLRVLTDPLLKRLQWFGVCGYYNQLVITSSAITHSIFIHHLLQNFREICKPTLQWVGW